MQTNQAFIYAVNGNIIPILPKNKTDFSLEELQGFVKGNIEVVSLKCGRYMIVNEEGKLNSFEYNEQASKLYGQEPLDFIVGDVLVTPTSFVR